MPRVNNHQHIPKRCGRDSTAQPCAITSLPWSERVVHAPNSATNHRATRAVSTTLTSWSSLSLGAPPRTLTTRPPRLHLNPGLTGPRIPPDGAGCVRERSQARQGVRAQEQRLVRPGYRLLYRDASKRQLFARASHFLPWLAQDPFLLALIEGDGSVYARVLTARLKQDEARIHVQSEDEPNRTLLETRISKDDGYQKQQGIRSLHAWLVE